VELFEPFVFQNVCVMMGWFLVVISVVLIIRRDDNENEGTDRILCRFRANLHVIGVEKD
jgi:hypothetical protein